MMQSSQCRMARAALKISVRELGEMAGVAANTVSRFETGKSRGYADTVAKIQKALEAAGVEFIDENGGGPGVRLLR
jgi:transcriptional regulator with XRE-family HTH domain